MEQQLGELMTAMTSIQKQNKAIRISVGSIEEIKPMVVELAEWKPTIEKAVAELRDEVGDIRAQLEKMVKQPASSPNQVKSESVKPDPVKPEEMAPLLPTLPRAKRLPERTVWEDGDDSVLVNFGGGEVADGLLLDAAMPMVMTATSNDDWNQ
ncbi:hypothetical protein OsI_22735 [Oryza sativa Indica Group]|uniref:DUF834 domain-containing protein n=1 Tax=Oryza sativa subsp. indica TaxID=39946 RepID=B8B141_ORYSI|nr:hypothetical protein OsI_22735 [Oryza sativa Indica Group]